MALRETRRQVALEIVSQTDPASWDWPSLIDELPENVRVVYATDGEPVSVRDQFARAARELRILWGFFQDEDSETANELGRALDQFDTAYALATEPPDVDAAVERGDL